MRSLSENAHKVMVGRYSARDEHNRATEEPRDILERTARVVSQTEYKYRNSIKPRDVEDKFIDLLTDFRFVPNGRTMANAGVGSKQLANCFVLPIDDEMGKTNDGIFAILRKAVLVLKSGGGVGFSFGRLRPKGDAVTRGKATGAVSFMKVFDTAFWVIGQGGGRRSACMAVLPVWHPDIHEFIHCKEQEGVIEHFNISVGITDAFMQAVEDDAPFDLINPRNNKVWETVRARDLFDEIVTFAHHNGEPGVLFLDAANRENQVPHQYTLETTNPCGEQWLGPYENCCMASINLLEHVREKSMDNGQPAKLFDYEVCWEKLQETVEWTVRWLDDVVDANHYVSGVPEFEEAAYRNRRIGVSIMGLADMMYKIGVPYGSDEAIDLTGQLMEFIRFHAMKMSVHLAQEREPFPGIVGSRYDFSAPMSGAADHFTPPVPREPYTHAFGRPPIAWDQLMADLKQHGIRNSYLTTIQPTGAIAIIADLEGYGCEPVFALSYVLKTREGAEEKGEGDWNELYYASRLFGEALGRYGLSEQERHAILQQVAVTGSCQNVELIPEEIRRVFVVSSDVSVDQHVMMQAALQAFTDNAISKTINFPADASRDDVRKAYLDGWKKGLKGMTVYVTGSRKTVVLETKETQDRGHKAEPHTDEPFAVKSDDYVGVHLTKVGPEGLVCSECGTHMVVAEGCFTCPRCAFSLCAVAG
jgi:ribonucleoside-diphosphate reductase alpha chain